MKKTIAFLLVIIIVSFSMSGCLNQMAAYSAGKSDNALKIAEWSLCNAASVGSIKRRYGQDEEKAKAWQKLCAGPTANILPIEDTE